MKKVFAILLISATISACGGSGKSGGTDTSAGANQTAKAAESNADTNANKTGTETATAVSTTDPGAKLMTASDCFTCHKIDTKVIGPAYKDVAAKYPPTEVNIDTLANKIIKGGQGNWGSTPMAPHPTISESDAKLMVKYVLSLKK
jgi:cytochrome c